MSKISMSDQGVTWKMVPVEPTSEHITEGSRSLRDSFGNPNQWARAKGVWDAIIASIPDQAAPAPPPLPTREEIKALLFEVNMAMCEVVGLDDMLRDEREDFYRGKYADAILALLNRGR